MTDATSIRPGQFVRLKTPDNSQIDGATGCVKILAEWGAYVATLSAASGEFRAAWHEMELLGDHPTELNGHVSANGHTTVKANLTTPGGPVLSQPEATGYVCDFCGSSRMKRAGPCLTCQECGAGGGCG